LKNVAGRDLEKRSGKPPERQMQHFFVDIATAVPQYLVCKHATAPFVGLHSEIGLQATQIFLRRHSLMATKKKAAKKKKKK